MLAEKATDATGGEWFPDRSDGFAWVSARPETEVHQAITNTATEAQGGWTLLGGPASIRASVSIVPPLSPAFVRLTKRMKEAFRPKGILNPGRI